MLFDSKTYKYVKEIKEKSSLTQLFPLDNKGIICGAFKKQV